MQCPSTLPTAVAAAFVRTLWKMNLSPGDDPPERSTSTDARPVVVSVRTNSPCGRPLPPACAIDALPATVAATAARMVTTIARRFVPVMPMTRPFMWRK